MIGKGADLPVQTCRYRQWVAGADLLVQTVGCGGGRGGGTDLLLMMVDNNMSLKHTHCTDQ